MLFTLYKQQKSLSQLFSSYLWFEMGVSHHDVFENFNSFYVIFVDYYK